MNNHKYKLLRRRFARAGVCSYAFAQAPQEKTVTVFGAKINYIERATRQSRRSSCSTASAAACELADRTRRRSPQNYHVFALDQVGFGKSDKPMLKYRVGTYVDFLDKFMSEN